MLNKRESILRQKNIKKMINQSQSVTLLSNLKTQTIRDLEDPESYMKSGEYIDKIQKRFQTQGEESTPIKQDVINIKFNKHQYIIHPEYMKRRGTMCMSEIWSQKMKKEFIRVNNENVLDAQKIGLYGQEYTSLYRPDKIEKESNIILKMNDLKIGIEVQPQTLKSILKQFQQRIPDHVLEKFEDEYISSQKLIAISVFKFTLYIQLKEGSKKTISPTQTVKLFHVTETQLKQQRSSQAIIPRKSTISTLPVINSSIVSSSKSIVFTQQQPGNYNKSQIVKNKDTTKTMRGKLERILNNCRDEILDDYKVTNKIDSFLNVDTIKKQEKHKAKLQLIFREKMQTLQERIQQEMMQNK